LPAQFHLRSWCNLAGLVSLATLGGGQIDTTENERQGRGIDFERQALTTIAGHALEATLLQSFIHQDQSITISHQDLVAIEHPIEEHEVISIEDVHVKIPFHDSAQTIKALAYVGGQGMNEDPRRTGKAKHDCSPQPRTTY